MTEPRESSHPRLAIVVDKVTTASPLPDRPLSGWQWEFLSRKIQRAGLRPSEVEVITLADFQSSSSNYLRPSLIVGMGGGTLSALTGRKGIDKWQMSPLETRDGIKFIGTFDFSRIQKQYELGVYLEMALRRAAEGFTDPSKPWPRLPERFLLNPPFEQTIEVLREIQKKDEVSIDIETGYGQINTFGVAWSESDAIAINLLPDRCGAPLYYSLLEEIDRLLRKESIKKVFQNFIYDVSYLSAYGLEVRGDIFDTMWAMKVLWPEFRSGLDNVGRFYTDRPYWKDDGRVSEEEGERKNWGNIRDWVRHYTYNCRDTTGTLEASRNQQRDLNHRGLNGFFGSYVSRLVPCVREMCARGMPLNLEVRKKLEGEVESEIARNLSVFKEGAGEVNPRSPKQVLSYLKSLNVPLPKKFDKNTGVYKESTDASSIKKIRLKRPEDKALKALQEIKALDKALSSYIKFRPRPDGRAPFSLNGCGTETLRFSGGTDPWGRGFNIQTLPREGGRVSIKQMFEAPKGWSFIEADLKAAETWYVAYASVCPRLIDMLMSGEDVHKHVTMAILKALGRKDSEYSKMWRNLGKKTGHGANYLMKEGTFVENVFKDMDMILSKRDGRLMLDSYFAEFPEIRFWHGQVKDELYRTRKLKAPTGWERYFYGRPGDEMLREAVPWAPQHTVPWIINHMMFHLCAERRKGNLNFHLISQVHDALYLLVPDEWVERVARSCLRVSEWHPKLTLPGGDLVIPVEIETAKRLSEKETFHDKTA